MVESEDRKLEGAWTPILVWTLYSIGNGDPLDVSNRSDLIIHVSSLLCF